ncbi:unnamed protein product [Ranitomeya imitator]|uniref:SH3 domain-containing protein n=1 Tax=Ranitomeya imitator TaxID=111125 RepID=A0ABN9LJF7_9NEOB|nr:unnamed protein product [Ranitomeya imitator]
MMSVALRCLDVAETRSYELKEDWHPVRLKETSQSCLPGIVACTLEHLLFDERYWLNSALVEDTEIQVSVNQDELATLYLGLLLQEGCFYARAVVHDAGAQVEEEKEFLAVSINDVVYVKDVGDESSWEGQSLSTGERGLLPIIAVEPLPHPFYQWFLKAYPTSCNVTEQNCRNITSQPIGLGQCTARENHSATEWDELSYCRGDAIEVVGFFVPGLKWFVGKCPSTGATGFVQTKHVDPNCLKPLGKDLLFLSEGEKISLNSFDEEAQKGPVELLSSLAQTDISSVYRLVKSSDLERIVGGGGVWLVTATDLDKLETWAERLEIVSANNDKCEGLYTWEEGINVTIKTTGSCEARKWLINFLNTPQNDFKCDVVPKKKWCCKNEKLLVNF